MEKVCMHPWMAFIFALLRQEDLPHSIRHAALKEGLIRSDGHPDLIAHPQQHQATLRAFQSGLPDQLIYSENTNQWSSTLAKTKKKHTTWLIDWSSHIKNEFFSKIENFGIKNLDN